MTDDDWPKIETKLRSDHLPKGKRMPEVFSDEEAKDKLEAPTYLFVEAVSKMAELFAIDGYGCVIINDGQMAAVAGGGRHDVVEFLNKVNIKMAETINEMIDERNEDVKRKNEIIEAEEKAAKEKVPQGNGEVPPPKGSWG